MKFLCDYLADKAIRVIDLFRAIDKDNNGSISRSRFIRNMKAIKVPLNEADLQSIADRVDTKGSGQITYR